MPWRQNEDACDVERKEKVQLTPRSVGIHWNTVRSEQALPDDKQKHVLRAGLESVCKRGIARPSWAVCGCQTCGVHSRDVGKDAGLAVSLEFETSCLTFMQAVAPQSRELC